MSRTLFRYIFWDLLRIFLMANGVLAGIMSFAGLLKPLTHNGLDASQVGQLLTWFTPAMCAYSFPIAALFSATVVYGRMSADNEIVACRATGIPHYMIAVPALVLGLLVAIVSLAFLCYVVPASTLKVEKVIYSNLAAFMQNKIERNHQIRFGHSTVFAQRAEVVPPSPGEPYTQRVVLENPTILTYERAGPEEIGFRIPAEFWMARKATLYIRTDEDGDNAELTAVLDGGMKFPRKNSSGWEGGIEVTQFGPFKFPSQVSENTKFMNIAQLKELDADKLKSRRINNLQQRFVAEEQEAMLHERIKAALAKDDQFIFAAGRDVYSLSKAPEDTFVIKGDRLYITSKAGNRSVRVTQDRNGVPTLNANAGEVRLRLRSDVKSQTMHATMELINLVLHEPDGDIERGNITQSFTLPMPAELAALGNIPIQKYASDKPQAPLTRRSLWRELLILKNDIASEMHGRGAFALSCLLLVMAGCALGMMFKSGNFLSAFALSFLPALLCITMIIAGQRTSGNIPHDFWNYSGFSDPLQMGVILIWSGNAFVACLAGVLMWRLHRT